jgi:hypothetical protein
MSEIKLKVILNKGRHGIVLHKLAKIAEEAEKFLAYFSQDLNLGSEEWVADNFRNGSVSFVANYVGGAQTTQVLRAQRALSELIDPRLDVVKLNGEISRRTYAQFARIANPLDADDSIGLGVLSESGKFVHKVLTKERATVIEREMNQVTEEFAGLQGYITALFKEGTCWLKEFVTNERIVCKFKAEQYPAIWKLLEDRDGLADVEGWLVCVNGETEFLKISSIARAPEYRDGDIDKFFGSDPKFTGGLSASDYLAEIRGDNK